MGAPLSAFFLCTSSSCHKKSRTPDEHFGAKQIPPGKTQPDFRIRILGSQCPHGTYRRESQNETNIKTRAERKPQTSIQGNIGQYKKARSLRTCCRMHRQGMDRRRSSSFCWRSCLGRSRVTHHESSNGRACTLSAPSESECSRFRWNSSRPPHVWGHLSLLGRTTPNRLQQLHMNIGACEQE